MDREHQASRKAPNRPSVGLAFLAAACLLPLAAPGISHGENGSKITLGGGATPIALDIDTRWVASNGYVPVRLNIRTTPATPALANRSFRVEFRPASQYIEREPAVVSTFLEIEQNATSAQTTLLVPKTRDWNSAELRVYEDGVYLPRLSSPSVSMMQTSNQYDETHLAVLFLSKDAPTLDDREKILNSGDTGNALQSVQLPSPSILSGAESGGGNAPDNVFKILSNTTRDQYAGLLPPSELPSKWLAYTSLDLFVTSLDDLQSLQKDHPPRWEAVMRWVRSGGNLLIVDDELINNLPAIDLLLDNPSWEDVSANRNGYEPVEQSFQPSVDTEYSEFQEYQYPGMMDATEAVRESVQPPSAPPQASPLDRDTLKPSGKNRVAAIRSSYGMGTVVVVDEDITKLRPPMGAKLLNRFGSIAWTWPRRHGISLLRDPNSVDYSSHLIPGLGKPPILLFFGSITLFVIIIGPLNYQLLKRWQRLYLMFVTVPLGASIVTTGIFMVAVFGDGLYCKLLERTCTTLDQTSGQLQVWSRQTYYAGMAPSGGLTFSADTAVYPIPNPTVRRHRAQVKALNWVDDEQRLRSGYIKSRRADQFLQIRSTPSEAKLEVDTSGSEVRVVNQLGAVIRLLVLCDADGQLHIGSNIASDAESALAVSDPSALTSQLANAIDQHNPLRRGNDVVYRQTRDYRERSLDRTLSRQFTFGEPMPESSSSRMEQVIKEAKSGAMKRGTYYAVLDSCPWSESGCTSKRLGETLHFLKGRWK